MHYLRCINRMQRFAAGFVLLLLPTLPIAASFSNPGLQNPFIGSSFGVPGANASFDYVVVGGGTAGLVIATRLVQQNHSVAVIEAGGFAELDNGNLSVIPADAVWFTGASPKDTQPLVDWGFVTSPQPAINDRVVHYARGKTLGGSSARNYLAYQRGTSQSYNLWAADVNDSSYRWDSFLKYFQKSTKFTPANNKIRAPNASAPYDPAAFTAEGGPLSVSFPNWGTPFSSWFSLGLETLGLKQVLGAVSGTLNGISFQMNTLNPSDQTRSSSQTSYLQQGLLEPSLAVYKNSIAQKIIIDGSNEANGVLVATQGLQYQLSAKKEVILSAGAIQSPQLLMLSGIGDCTELSKFNISCLKNLPGVGKNLWDHWFFGPTYRVDVTTHSAVGNSAYLAEATKEYSGNQTGILTNSGADVFGWQKVSTIEGIDLSESTKQALSVFPEDWPELEYLALDAYAGDMQNFIQGAPKTPYNYIGAMAAIVAPLSRGNITLASKSIADAPVINPNWLSNPADQEMAVLGFKRMRKIMTSSALKPIVQEEVFPGLNVSSDAQILESVKNDGLCLFHASGTCKMGNKTDAAAVVDSQCCVYGVKNLRVVDSSAFPFLPPGHPQSTVYALAEKIADLINGD